MKTKMPIRLNVALPNGSLEKETRRVFRLAGIKIPGNNRRTYYTDVDHPLIRSIRFFRPQHIPDIVLSEVCDVGICGLDCVAELCGLSAEKDGACKIDNPRITILAKLNYGRPGRNGKTKIVVCGSLRDAGGYLRTNGLDNQWDLFLNGMDVITEYPEMTRRFFKEKYKTKINAILSYGSTEGMVPYPYRLGICLVDTGRTLAANHLKILDVIMKSSTVLIRKTMKWELEYKGHDADVEVAAEKLKRLLIKGNAKDL